MRGRRLFRWALPDVLVRCEPACPGECQRLAACGVRGPCAGRRSGHVRIDDAIAMRARVDQETWEAEMLCLRPRRTNLVLAAFSAEIHVWGEQGTRDKETEGLSAGWPAPGSPTSSLSPSVPESLLLCGMDFGLRSPTVVLWGQLDAAGVLRIVDERVVRDEVLERHVEAILGSPWGLPAWIGIDPAGANRNDQTGVSSAEVMEKAGLVVRHRRTEVQRGLALLRARLAPADGSAPRLLVHARCRELIKSLETYRYDPERPRSMEPLKDGADHAVDALRYLVTCLDEVWEGKAGSYT